MIAPRWHSLAPADDVAGVVGVACLDAITVIDDDDVAVTALRPAESHGAARSCSNRCADWNRVLNRGESSPTVDRIGRKCGRAAAIRNFE